MTALSRIMSEPPRPGTGGLDEKARTTVAWPRAELRQLIKACAPDGPYTSFGDLPKLIRLRDSCSLGYAIKRAQRKARQRKDSGLMTGGMQ